MTRDKHGRQPPPPVDRGAFVFGEMVRAMRLRARLSQAALAALVGQTQSAVAHHEGGEYGMRESNLLAYARALGFESLLDFVEAGARELRRAEKVSS